MTQKTERLVIKCSPETKKMFKMLSARLGREYEDVLRLLIEKANNEWFPETVY